MQNDIVLFSRWGLVFRINRDSIVESHNDSILGANHLSYLFQEAASDYFTKDSAFAFSTPEERSSGTQAFQLREINNASKDTTSYILVYVSNTRLEMRAHDKMLAFSRVN